MLDERLTALPEGYVAVGLEESHPGRLRIALIVRKKPDPAAGHFVPLDSAAGTLSRLGALVDARGTVHQWLEVAFQDVEPHSADFGLHDIVPTNAMLDKQWRQNMRALETLGASAIVATGWEEEPPPPLYIDLGAMAPWFPRHAESGEEWRLCRDDGLLASKGLPTYSGSLHRYLFLPSLGADSPVVPVSAGAPETDSTPPLASLLPQGAEMAPVNPAAGLMCVRPWQPVHAEALLEALSEGAWPEPDFGVTPFEDGAPPGPEAQEAKPWQGEGRLFLACHGRSGKLAEMLHLKVRFLADAFANVRAFTRMVQRPMLNLSPLSFRVRREASGAGLPDLWATVLEMVDPGQSFALPLEGSDVFYHLRWGTPRAPIYQPEAGSMLPGGQASVRIRSILSAAKNQTVVEGTFATYDLGHVGPNDLVCFNLHLACGRLALQAHLNKEGALAADEWRFRTLGHTLTEEQSQCLNGIEGRPMGNVPFRLVPLLSSPCDLYSLGVLAVRTLLTNKGTTLARTLDDVFAFARQLGAQHDAGAPLEERIAALFDSDKRWVESLGPHALLNEEIPVEEAVALLPASLWQKILGWVVRLFPGAGPDSFCKDFGDAPPQRLHAVYDDPLAIMDTLLAETRSLIVMDWRFNNEVRTVINRCLARMEAGEKG